MRRRRRVHMPETSSKQSQALSAAAAVDVRNMAQAGGKKPEGVADALAKAAELEVVSEQVK